jgi:hypothetical protein
MGDATSHPADTERATSPWFVYLPVATTGNLMRFVEAGYDGYAPKMNYHPDMIRSLGVAVAAVALTAAGPAGVAPAEPSPPTACSYALSPPHVVQLSGTNMVTATLVPSACNRSEPYLSVACVQLQGSDGAPQCQQGEGDLPAQVYYAPYQPGATYIATGRGCAVTGNPPQPVCQPMGPFTATL